MSCKLNYLLSFFIVICLYGEVSFASKNTEIVSLLAGKSITVVAPASGAKEYLSKLASIKGLNLNIPKQCFSSPTKFHSASDGVRFSCFRDALYDNSSVIWALRGGYGCAKIIGELQKLPKPEKEKVFIGYSDNTALHLFLTQEWGWKSIHGSCIEEIIDHEETDRGNFIKINKIISRKTNTARISGLIPVNQLARNSTRIESSLTGGNITILETSIGTSWQIISSKKILFLEDVHIRPYMLDRSLLHLSQSGIFEGVDAIIFGDISGSKGDMLSVINDFSQSINIPVFRSNRFGHEKINDPIIYNTKSVITKDKSGYYNLIMEI